MSQPLMTLAVARDFINALRLYSEAITNFDMKGDCGPGRCESLRLEMERHETRLEDVLTKVRVGEDGYSGHYVDGALSLTQVVKGERTEMEEDEHRG